MIDDIHSNRTKKKEKRNGKSILLCLGSVRTHSIQFNSGIKTEREQITLKENQSSVMNTKNIFFIVNNE